MRPLTRFTQDGSGHTIDTDALIIGSGFGAAAPALRLAAAGLRVQVVERGARHRPSDFERTQDPTYLVRHIRSVGDGEIGLTYASAYGGASPFYEMVSLRAPAAAFEQRDEDGRRLWPADLDRAVLDPYYELAERTLGVRQLAHDQIPRTGQVFAMLMQGAGHPCARAPMAIGACAGSGYCVTGCVFGAKRDLTATYLARAETAGAAIGTGWSVYRIEPLSGRAAGGGSGAPYRFLVTCTRPAGAPDRYFRRRYRARLVVLAAGTIGSAAVLAASRSSLGDLGRNVGRHVAFNSSTKVVALLPDALPDVDNFTGPSIPGVVSYSLLESHGLTILPAKPLPLQLIASARFRARIGARLGEYWGPDNVRFMRRYRRRGLVLVGLAQNPPVARLDCDAGQEGEPGRVGVRVQSEAALRQMQDRRAVHAGVLADLLQGAGCTMVEVEPITLDGSAKDDRHFSSSHHVGSCRMADSPEDGVVDVEGQVFGHPGLYVTDGSAIPAAPGVNPSLTILANAERIAARLVRRHAPGGR